MRQEKFETGAGNVTEGLSKYAAFSTSIQQYVHKFRQNSFA